MRTFLRVSSLGAVCQRENGNSMADIVVEPDTAPVAGPEIGGVLYLRRSLQTLRQKRKIKVPTVPVTKHKSVTDEHDKEGA